MTYINTVPPDEATGKVRELYERDLENTGLLSSFTRTKSLRPEVWEAYLSLSAAISSNMDPRRYELATIVTASRLR